MALLRKQFQAVVRRKKALDQQMSIETLEDMHELQGQGLIRSLFANYEHDEVLYDMMCVDFKMQARFQ